MSYFPGISQNVLSDTANSYASTIAAGVTWNSAGVGTSTLGVAGIQITVASDRNLHIYIDQGRTNASFQVTDEYDYNVIKGNFGLTVQAVGAYVRVRAKNITGTIANVLIDTVLCPIVEAVPRSLDENQYLKTAIYELNDEYGNKGIISPVGALDVNQPYRLVGASFGSAIDTIFWTATNNGAASAAGVATGFATVVSGTDANGYGMIQSVRNSRFIIGNPNKYRGLVRIPALTKAGTTRVWGAFTTTGTGATPPSVDNGFFFSLNASDVLSVNCFNTGAASIASVSSGSFNGTVSQYTMDVNVHVYNIVYYLGKIQFYIDEILIHTFTPTTVFPSLTFNLPANTYVKNSGTTSASIEVWSASIHRLGREISSPVWRNIHGITAGTGISLKVGQGYLHSVIVNSAGATSTVSLYDGLSAVNPIALITGLSASTPPVTITYGIDYYAGLWIATAHASTDITVIFE